MRWPTSVWIGRSGTDPRVGPADPPDGPLQNQQRVTPIVRLLQEYRGDVQALRQSIRPSRMARAQASERDDVPSFRKRLVKCF